MSTGPFHPIFSQAMSNPLVSRSAQVPTWSGTDIGPMARRPWEGETEGDGRTRVVRHCQMFELLCGFGYQTKEVFE